MMVADDRAITLSPWGSEVECDPQSEWYEHRRDDPLERSRSGE
jgi:hypothetical protein